MNANKSYLVGTAGWSIPKSAAHLFGPQGTHLERYSRVFNAVEINSSFYREHKPETYFKWAQATPEQFRFSVKLSRYFTQEKRLADSGALLKQTLLGIGHLGEKWGALLVQLPPSLDFDLRVSEKFLSELRKQYTGKVVWEPRHQSWASPAATDLLHAYSINKVLADPELCRLSAEQRALLESTRYYRLHGTPEIYKSRYEIERIHNLAEKMEHPSTLAEHTWCIFDNTTFGFATENAYELQNLLTKREMSLQSQAEHNNSSVHL